MDKKKLFNIEYSMLFGLYMVVYAAGQGFAVVFLQARGYTNTEIGLILAASNVAALIIQPVLASLSDRSGSLTVSRVLILMGLVSAALSLLIITVPRRGVVLSAAYTLFIGFVFSKQPFCNSLAAEFARRGCAIDFGISRGIGSLFYAITVAVMGSLVAAAGVGAVPVVSLGGIICFIAVAAVVSRQLGTEKFVRRGGRDEGGFIKMFRKYRRFAVLNAGIVVMLFTHCMMSNFTINIVGQFGGDSGDMGTLVAVIAIIETIGMLVFHRLARRFSCSELLAVSCVMFTVKQLLFTLAWNMPMLYVAALAQGASYGTFIPASVRYVNELVAPEDAVLGQTCITAMITIGALLSGLAGGILIDALGVHAMMVVGTAVSAVGTVIALPGIEKVK